MVEKVDQAKLDSFIAHWVGHKGGREMSNFAPFIFGMCSALGIPAPEGGAEKGKLGNYEFEGPVPGGSFRTEDGTGSIDLYRRGYFILEAKQSYLPKGKENQAELFDPDDSAPVAPSGARYDKLMRKAFRQAKNYAVNLPGEHPWPTFLIVCDIGRAFEIYVDTTGNGRGYEFFPDKQSYRIELQALANDAEVGKTGYNALELLCAIWTKPKSVDPRFQSADVTRKVAANLASVSSYLEDGIKGRGLNLRDRAVEIEEASLFMMRILFCMFAEDIGLLPEDKFKNFLKRAESNDGLFQNGLADLFQKMNNADASGRFAHALESNVRYFNGGLFESDRTYPVGGFVIHDLYEAARQNWRKVEPAIFGTLLEQALTEEERAKLGAHYTPRAYVETLVRATIMDVLELEWEAVEELPEDEIAVAATAFQEKLASLRILDPACGTGNFLYVSMELLQALEARVIERIETLGGHAESQIGPHQFHGLEKNPRAAKIAELVLWIGWLRNRLKDDPESIPDPVLKESANINFGLPGGYDAVLKQTKLGEPDFDKPSMPKWPEADFIVGNPPFIGGKDLRDKLGGDYAEALWKANARVPKSADFVMQWWDRAAHILTAKNSPLIRFGFVTTNSITQEFSRRVIAGYLSKSISPSLSREGEGVGATPQVALAKRTEPIAEASDASASPPPPNPSSEEEGLSLIMAIPDHPWTKATKDAAAVRIAMTVAERGSHTGQLREVTTEAMLDSDEPEVKMALFNGIIRANLKTGIDLTKAKNLVGNAGVSVRGVEFHGDGYKLTEQQYREWSKEAPYFFGKFVKPFMSSRGYKLNRIENWVTDIYKVSEKHVRKTAPGLYQHLLKTAYEDRKDNTVNFRRENWWRLALPHDELRRSTACLDRYIATMVTAKHRVFSFVDGSIRPDQGLMVISSSDAYVLGTIQSKIHVEWSLSHGGTLEDRPRYNNTKIFDPFPFPDATKAQRATIADLAEELDETRKLAIAETDKLTMTELYNLREKLRSGDPLSDKDERRAVKARAGIVDRLHQQLDQAVADAYGWGEEWSAGTLGPSEIVARLVALNHERAAEEADGKIRWLRPDYQKPRFAPKK